MRLSLALRALRGPCPRAAQLALGAIDRPWRRGSEGANYRLRPVLWRNAYERFEKLRFFFICPHTQQWQPQ